MSDPSAFLPLPAAQFHILVALSAGPSHGYAIMQQVEETSGSLVKIGPASLYGSLKKLGDQGLIDETSSSSSGADQRRRYYELTELGGQVCLAEADRLASLARRTQRNLRPRHA